MSGIPAFGQVFELSLPRTAPGRDVVVELSITSPSGREPSALQWEISFPTVQIRLIKGSPQLGPVAQAADKLITCAPRAKTSETQTMVCLVLGGQKSIASGVVAKFSFEIQKPAPSETARVRIDRGLAVSADLKRADIPSVEAEVALGGK